MKEIAVATRRVIGTGDSLPVLPHGPADNFDPKELIRQIAMDIGKDVVHHIEIMYPAAIAACPSTFKVSVCNHVYNDIMAAIQVNDTGQIEARLKDRKEHRRKIKAIYRKIRR